MITIAILYLCGVVIFIIFTNHTGQVNTVSENTVLQLNDITKTAEQCWDSIESLSEGGWNADFYVIDSLGKTRYASGKGQNANERITVETAVKNRYPYSYVFVDGQAVGNVILIDSGTAMIDRLRNRMILGLALGGLIILAGILLFGRFIQNSIISPFRKMEEFAGKVAEGNLDEPLLMDQENLFGAFSESFDIMREELAESKKRELALQKKERELVASLSHDLKTPITGIKVTAELMKAKLTMSAMEEDVAKKKTGSATENIENPAWNKEQDALTADLIDKIDSIYQKVDQIDVLVSDLFTTTLDDLGEIKVNCGDEESKILSEIVKRYDDKGLVNSSEIPDAILFMDSRRMGQVIGNIISNSYKYAGTKIDVQYELTEEFMKMQIRDYGPGVPSSEIELITNKFYRGKQWADSKEEGNGLGLYIAKILMEKMKGSLVLETVQPGLCVTLLIPLS